MTGITTTSSTKEPAPASQPTEKKSLWETTITSTPVLLTVVATLLAGMSASEMTLAQYHRATAAQDQSKAADEFNFFQAKKIRGTSMELTATLLRALSEPDNFSADAVRDSAGLLAENLSQASQEVQRLKQRAKNLNRPGTAGMDSTAVTEAINKAAEQISKASKSAAELKADTDNVLANGKGDVTPKNLEEAFGYLAGGLPKVEISDVYEGIDSQEAKAIKEALQHVRDRNPEAKTDPLMRRIDGDTLKKTYHRAVQNAKTFDKEVEKVKSSMSLINRLVGKQLELARSFHRAVLNLNRTLATSQAESSKEMTDVRSSLTALTNLDRVTKDSTEQLYRDARSASLDYDARRYNEEGKYNLEAAMLYELQVRWSNFKSDRHLNRKTFLFYAMLAAQAGVTVATLALALRRKSLVWGLAALAGAAAVIFGGYISVMM